MIVYIVKDNCFARFSENNWQKITLDSSVEVVSSASKFVSIKMNLFCLIKMIIIIYI